MPSAASRDMAVRWTSYAAAMLLLLFLHSLTFAHLRIWGVVPFLPPLLLATTASFEPERDAVVFGICFGVICDLTLTATVPCLYTVAFTAAALLSALIAKGVLQPGFFCSLAVSAMTFLLVDSISSLALCMSGRAAFMDCLLLTLRETAASLPLLLVCHPVLSYLHRRFTI